MPEFLLICPGCDETIIRVTGTAAMIKNVKAECEVCGFKGELSDFMREISESRDA